MSTKIATIDFHITTECNQECSYCWGPHNFADPVDTETALRIVSRVKEVGAARIVFTGGDPLKRSDICRLIRHAKRIELEVALSTTGDEVTEMFLKDVGALIDLISLPLDGATEKVNSRTKKKEHFTAVMRTLDLLRGYPEIDVKIAIPVTRHNLAHVPDLIQLAKKYARTTKARVFCNVFQVFPRAVFPVDWDDLLVTREEFASLERQITERPGVHLNFLNHETLDRLYAMIFPDGSLVIPNGPDYLNFGQFLEIEDFNGMLEASRFDSAKHLRHSRGWRKTEHALEGPAETSPTKDKSDRKTAKLPVRDLAA